jgi:hypothetical protein
MKKSNVKTHDENGFELNYRGLSDYKGVYWCSRRQKYGVSVTIAKNDMYLSDYKSRSLKISYHDDELEAAWYYNTFINDIKDNIVIFNKTRSGNWTPSTSDVNMLHEKLENNLPDNVVITKLPACLIWEIRIDGKMIAYYNTRNLAISHATIFITDIVNNLRIVRNNYPGTWLPCMNASLWTKPQYKIIPKL